MEPVLFYEITFILIVYIEATKTKKIVIASLLIAQRKQLYL